MPKTRKRVPNTRMIRVDDDIWEAIEKQAIPFEETPNQLLRRKLGLGRQKHVGHAQRSTARRHPTSINEG